FPDRIGTSNDIRKALESYEPGYHTHEYTYANECIDIGHEIGVNAKHNASEQWHVFFLLLAIYEVPKTYGAEESGTHQCGPNIHPGPLQPSWSPIRPWWADDAAHRPPSRARLEARPRLSHPGDEPERLDPDPSRHGPRRTGAT